MGVEIVKEMIKNLERIAAGEKVYIIRPAQPIILLSGKALNDK